MKYKHDDPRHLAFGRSGDSKLLAKSRGYAAGGRVKMPPVDPDDQRYWNTERWMGRDMIDPELEDDPKDELEENRDRMRVQEPQEEGPVQEQMKTRDKDI